MKVLHLTIIIIMVLSAISTIGATNTFAQNGIIIEENTTSSKHPAHIMYPTVNVTKFMSIAENSTEFKEKVNGYAHYFLATVILKPKFQNTSSATMEYNLVYDLYKKPSGYCSYDEELVVTLSVQLKVLGTAEYSPYGVPAGYPLPSMECVMNYVPSNVDYNKLVMTIPWSPPLEQLNYGILAKNVQCINGLTLVIKAEDGTPACVWPNTVQKLIERGWATNASQSDSMANLANNTGVITLRNQTYYFETPNYTSDAYLHPMHISFHDVNFTLFPNGFRGGLPIPCSSKPESFQYYWADAKFPDNTHELLHILTDSPPCPTNPNPYMLSNHTGPQAGLTFYDGKMNLLVSKDLQNQTLSQNSNSTSFNEPESKLGPDLLGPIPHHDLTNSTSDTSLLDLVLTTNSSTIQQGHAISIDVLLNNTSTGPLTIESQNDWPVRGLTWVPCVGMPFGIALFDGYYSQENMTQGKPLILFPGKVFHCNMYRVDNRQGTTYVFQPLSDIALLESTSGNFSDEMRDNFWLSSFNDGIIFERGTYTIVAGDEWGHLAIQHFTVTNTTQS